MNRLQSELHRLYVPLDGQSPDADPAAPRLVDAAGRVRAMVLELARPADWAALSRVWQGVQADLALPAPAIAVSGSEGCQLWFSLAQPVPAAQAAAFHDALRLRYLGDIKPQRLTLWPAPDAATPPQWRHAALVPAPQAAPGHWSAFVAPDLAPVFADEPWLDTPPSPEGQADLLARLKSIPLAEFERALAQLVPAAMPGLPPVQASNAGTAADPTRFLLDVMNNETVALALRIEAAKALLPYFNGPGRP